MNHIRQSLVGRFLNFFAILAFLVLQVPGAAFADSGTKVTHEALKFFVPEKRIRLDAAVIDPKGVTMVRAYFKSKTQADYVFVPMEAQQTAKDGYVATLPAMAKSNDEIQYLFLVVNGANEVLKTEPFVVKAKDSKEVPSWQMVSDDGSVKLFTEVPDAPAVAASFSDSVSLNVVESGARFGLVAQLYGASGSATASGAAAGATNAGTAAVATAGLSTVTLVAAAAAVGGVAVAGGGKSGGSSSAAPTPTPTTPVVLTSTTIVGVFGISGGKPGLTTMSGSWTFSTSGTFSNSLVETFSATGKTVPYQGTGSWSLSGTSLTLTDSFGGAFGGTATGSSNTFTLVRADGYVLNFSR
jgi:hypothetical protein